MDKTADLLEGIEYFFNALKEKCSSDEEYAAEILKARGFLLEDEGLTLSDNSHRDDASYLNELLKADKLGKVKDDKIFIKPKANIEKIFYKDNFIGYETLLYPQSWRRFISNSHAPKVPLRILEPFVGRYVKAVSACGVATSMSCDGNHSYLSERNISRIFVEFRRQPNSLWHKIICKRLLVGRFDLNWSCSQKWLEIKFDKADKWRTYTEFNRAAEFLYNNRIKIRQIRREAADGITTSMERHLSSDELVKIFSERANKLFDENF